MTNQLFEEMTNALEAEKEAHLETFFTLLRQKSISAQNTGVKECANLLEDMMKDAGIDAKQLETGGQPVVYGEVINPENDFTILFYGHYDVQPPEPFELWESDPFEPTIKDGKIYARGTGDNKGQLIAHVLAVKTLLKTHGSLPVNVKFLFEGEEEIGSVNLAPFVEKHKDLLKADLAYTADGPMKGPGEPLIKLGTRGLLYVELNAKGAVRDNHSGNKGNIAPNPAMDLINLIRTLVDEDGKVHIDGFYDDIVEPTAEELEHLRSLPFDPVETAEIVGVDSLEMSPEEYYSNLAFKPTFNIAGFGSGYTGEGSKTIIPSEAKVKIDMRLIANQDPDKIFDALKKHVDHFDAKSSITVEKLGPVKPSRTPMHLEVVQKVAKAIKATYNGTDPLLIPATGGTGPMYVFTDILGIPSLNVPYANVDEDNHAPNEKMGIKEFHDGIRTTCAAILTLGAKM